MFCDGCLSVPPREQWWYPTPMHRTVASLTQETFCCVNKWVLEGSRESSWYFTSTYVGISIFSKNLYSSSYLFLKTVGYRRSLLFLQMEELIFKFVTEVRLALLARNTEVSCCTRHHKISPFYFYYFKESYK